MNRTRAVDSNERVALWAFLAVSKEGRRVRRAQSLRHPLVFPCLLLGFCSLCLCAQGRERAGSTEAEQFFIISSVDSNKQQLVLKRPTEVTLLVRVNRTTAYSDQQGRPLHLKDFRAGDTVYVTLRSRAEGPPVITRIRKGLMTLEELRRRYLRGATGVE
jgi:hypothetical protein